MIKTTMEKHTINWLRRENRKGNLDFSISIQRKEVWDLEHKSNLIGAILLGVPVESLLFEEDGEGGYAVLDGKQRSTTLLKFINDEFEISPKCKIQTVQGENLVGKKFSELSEGLKDEILEFELSISTLRPLTEEEREIVFFMRNQAVSLTSVELTRVLLGSSSMAKVEKLSKHSFFKKTGLSTVASINKCKDQQVVLECILLDTGKNLGFSSKDIRKFAEEIKEEGIDDSLENKFISTFNYLDSAIPEKSKYLKKIHIPMVYSVAQLAMKDNIPGEVFFDWMESFFKFLKENPENEYTNAVSSSSALLLNVRKRIDFIQRHFRDNVEGASKVVGL